MDIVALISKHIELKKIGSHTWRGLCPFHDDTGTPNFTVYENTNSYHCFACGAHGNIRDWIREMEDEKDFDLTKINFVRKETWQEKNAKLALILSEFLRERKQTMSIGKWKKVVGMVFKLLRRRLKDEDRAEIYRRVVGKKRLKHRGEVSHGV